MPTIPLYDASAPPDGYHRVTAPGGYEWWSITANKPHFTIDFCDGNPCDPAYQSAFRRYLAHPTRIPPPVPRDYPLVQARLTEALRVFGGAAPKGAFRYSEQPPTIMIGGSSVVWKSEGSLIITLAGLATADGRQTLEGELTFDVTELSVPEGKHVLEEVCKEGVVSGALRVRPGGVVCEVAGEAEYTHGFSARPEWAR